MCDSTLERWMAEKEGQGVTSPVEILLQATKGVEFLHSLGVVHRDLKPSNILLRKVSGNGIVVKISDFGISKEISEGKSEFSYHPGTGAGTEGWAAPEVVQLLAERQAGSKVMPMTKAMDIFSLGCIYYYVLSSGSHPFGNDKIHRQPRILNNETYINLTSMKYSHVSSVFLIQQMIHPVPKSRPKASVILSHPIFWGKQRSLQFLEQVSTQFENYPKACAHSANILESHADLIRGLEKSPWVTHLSPALARYISEGSLPSTAMIHLVVHLSSMHRMFPELPLTLQNELGQPPHNFLNYWVKAFPFLVVVVWTSFQNLKEEGPLREYYPSKNFTFNLIHPEDNAIAHFFSAHKSIQNNPKYDDSTSFDDSKRIDEEAVFQAVATGSLKRIKLVCQEYQAQTRKPVSSILTKWRGVVQSPFHVAVQHREYPVVEYFVDEVGLRQKLQFKQIPLIVQFALVGSRNLSQDQIQEKIKIIQLLAGINRELLNQDAKEQGSVPLLVQGGVHLDLVLAMIQCGADLWREDKHQRNVLHKLHLDMSPPEYHRLMKFLVDTNRLHELSRMDAYNWLPLHYAVRDLELHPETISLLLKVVSSTSTTTKDTNLLDSLISVAIEGHRSITVLQTLQQAGANIHGNSVGEGESLVHKAARYGNLVAAQYFITLGVRGDSLSYESATPLHLALQSGHPNALQMVSLLVEKGADVHRGGGKESLLTLAVKQSEPRGRLGIVKLLLRAGVRVSNKDSNGWTMLHHAAATFSPAEFHELVNHLVQLGKVSCFIAKTSDDGASPLLKAVKNFDVLESTVKLMVANGVKINKTDGNGTSVIHLAVRSGRSLECVSGLVSCGANCSLRNATKETPLHEAAAVGNVEVIGFLVKHGGDINSVNEKGESPLHKAVLSEMMPKGKKHEAIEALVKAGASLGAKNGKGLTAFQLASSGQGGPHSLEQRTLGLIKPPK